MRFEKGIRDDELKINFIALGVRINDSEGAKKYQWIRLSCRFSQITHSAEKIATGKGVYDGWRWWCDGTFHLSQKNFYIYSQSYYTDHQQKFIFKFYSYSTYSPK